MVLTVPHEDAHDESSKAWNGNQDGLKDFQDTLPAYPDLNAHEEDHFEDDDKLAARVSEIPDPPPENQADLKVPISFANEKRPLPAKKVLEEPHLISCNEFFAPNGEMDIDDVITDFRRGIETVISLFLDVLLLFLEIIVGFWLAHLLKSNGNVASYQGMIILFFIPSLVNALLWVNLYKSYPHISYYFMLAVTVFGIPSPLLVYIWHLYKAVFCSKEEGLKSKLLANTFRIAQAMTCSLPLIVLNFYTILSIMRKDGNEDDAFDIGQLKTHLETGINVKIHGLAAIVSFCNIMRAACVFNERQTLTLLFVLVGCPFLLFTTLTRTLAMTMIMCFADAWWVIILIIVLIASNMIFYVICAKRSSFEGRSSLPSRETLMRDFPSGSFRGDIEEQLEMRCKLESRASSDRSENDDQGCCASHPKDSVVPSQQGQKPSCWDQLPRIFIMSICSSVIPIGYTNDQRSHHPRLKGGLFIVLNFLFNMTLIGLALGLTILHKVPNTFHGVSLPQPSLVVDIPSSQVKVQAGGFDVAFNLPNSEIDLGQMPSVETTFSTDSTDRLHAIIVPCLLAIVTVPFVIMRAAMMELDCFVARKKEIHRSYYDKGDMVDGPAASIMTLGHAVKKNSEDKGLKARLYLTVLCSVFGMTMFTFLLLLTIIVTVFN